MDGSDQTRTLENESLTKRRSFIKFTAALAAVAAATACNQKPEDIPQSQRVPEVQGHESAPTTDTPQTLEEQMEEINKKKDIMRGEYEKADLRMLERSFPFGNNILETGVIVGGKLYSKAIKEGTELANSPPLNLRYDPNVTLLHLCPQGILGVGCVSPNFFPFPEDLEEVYIKDLALESMQTGNDPYKKFKLDHENASYIGIPILHGGPPSSIVPVYENGKVKVKHQEIKVSPPEEQRKDDTAYYSYALLEVTNMGNGTYIATVKGVIDNNKSKLYLSLFDIPVDIDNTLRSQE